MWLNRQKCIKANRLLERLENHLNKESSDDFSFIAYHVLKTNQESESNVLDDVSRKKLENTLGSNLSNYALSILISYALRSDDKGLKEDVIEFFRTGNCKFNGKPYEKEFHLKDFFILLTGIKVSGLNLIGLNLSGHCLSKMKAENCNINESHFRFCNFEGSLLERSNLSKTNFENSNSLQGLEIEKELCKQYFTTFLFRFSFIAVLR